MAATPCRVADLPGLVVIARHCLRECMSIGCEDLDILLMTRVRTMNWCEITGVADAQSDTKAEMPVCTKAAMLVRIELCELIAAVTFRQPL